jgi:hypothetical protein
MKNEKFIKRWGKYRQEGKEKYIHKRSVFTAGGMLIGLSAGRLFRGDLTFFNFANLILNFVVIYIAAGISTTYTWKRNEEKYSRLINKYICLKC